MTFHFDKKPLKTVMTGLQSKFLNFIFNINYWNVWLPKRPTDTQIYTKLIESIPTLKKGQGNPMSVHDLPSMTRLANSWMLQIMDTRMEFPCPFCNVVIDYFSPTPLIFLEKPHVNATLVLQSTVA